MNWALHRPRTPRARTIRSIVATISVLVARATVRGGNIADAVAAVDAGPLDVLEEPRDQHPLAVADRVDVDLDPLEVAVDPDRPVGVDDRRGRELADEVVGRVAEVDREPADDEARPDDDRVADPLGEGQRLLDAVGHAAVRLGDAEPVEERREPRPLLGLVDRLEVAAEQRDAARRRAARRGSAASGRRTRRPPAGARPPGGVSASITLRTLSGSSGSKYSRELASKSVETVSGFELIITACQPAPAERVGGLDRAVVELDPLPDPDRARCR